MKRNEEERISFQNKMKEHNQMSRTIVYIDESGFAHDMPRLYGYSTRGTRCYGTRDWGAKGRTNVIGALVDKELVSVELVNQNINTSVFSDYIVNKLLPKLPKESVIVMDNASFHKSKHMQDKIKSAGCILQYLPTYSPDLNPIEHKWAERKSLRRKLACDVKSLFAAEVLCI